MTDYDPPYASWEALDLILHEYHFDTVLDVGCGEGMQSKIFMENGKRVTCIDKGGSIYFDKNDGKSNVIIGDFNDIVLNTSFDCVWCSHILEHQLNVNSFLRKIHSVLKEDGV